jgi:hypothetical protein
MTTNPMTYSSYLVSSLLCTVKSAWDAPYGRFTEATVLHRFALTPYEILDG